MVEGVISLVSLWVKLPVEIVIWLLMPGNLALVGYSFVVAPSITDAEELQQRGK